MKTIVRNVLLLTLLTTPAFANPFALTLPEGYAAFTSQTQTTASPEGPIETTTWVAKAPTNEAIVVTMSRMPGKILDPEKLIASTRESLMKSLGATSESDETFRSNAAFFRSRFVVQDDRLFQLLYVGRSEEQRSNAVVSQLFDSFKLLQ